MSQKYVSELCENLVCCYEFARKQLKKTADMQKRNYDIHIADHKYSVCVLVYKKNFVRKKLDVLWVGPFVVVRNIGDVVYEIRDRVKTHSVHHNNLQPYFSEVIPKWTKNLQVKVLGKY